jgi:hypothetical protein
MRDFNTIQLETGEPTGGELKAACEHVVRELVNGVRHEFFEMVVTVEIVQSKKKSITIKAGRSHRFTVQS